MSIRLHNYDEVRAYPEKEHVDWLRTLTPRHINALGRLLATEGADGLLRECRDAELCQHVRTSDQAESGARGCPWPRRHALRYGGADRMPLERAQCLAAARPNSHNGSRPVNQASIQRLKISCRKSESAFRQTNML
jgi:hypothetical protein